MCSLLGVSPSGYYAWLNRSPSSREVADRQLRDRIVDIHSRSRGTYGAPRVHAELAAEGICVGRKGVARLMRLASIQGVHRRRKVTTTRRNPERAAAPDLVKREFTADGPDRTWVADITYIPTKAGFLYLAVVLDLWSRKVVGWSMRDDLATPLVTDALDMAIEQRKPDRVIHHSDRGSQYTSTAFGARCEQAGIAVSMGRRGDAYDNAVAESHFRHPRDRTPRPGQLRNPEPGPIRGLQLFRGLLQPPPAALSHRLPLTRRLRKETPTTLWITNREVSKKAGQLQSSGHALGVRHRGCGHARPGVRYRHLPHPPIPSPRHRNRPTRS